MINVRFSPSESLYMNAIDTKKCNVKNCKVIEKKQTDSFEKSKDYLNGNYIYEKKARSYKYISQSLLKVINSNYSNVSLRDDKFVCDGIEFTKEQIPKVDVKTLNEVKAQNNVIDFGKLSFFKYVNKAGREMCLFTKNGAIGTAVSERLRGEPYDAECERYAAFWNFLMGNSTVYLGLFYSKLEVNNYLDEAGVEKGFFTIKMGDREATLFRSSSESRGPIQSKERYDLRYKSLTADGSLLNNYETGSVFKVNGKEYTLSENHTLDIPYGEDIYKLEYPSNYRFGKKIEE